MRARWMHAALVLGCFAGPSWAEGGLTIDANQVPWPRVQTRIGIASTLPLGTDLAAGYNLQGGHLLGDYYFGSAPMFGSSRAAGGFRATSGLLLNGRGASLSTPTVPRPGWALTVSQQGQAAAAPPDAGIAGPDSHAVPYLGVGYTGLSVKGTWGFTADLGVMAVNPGTGLQAGKLLSGQSLDEMLRDLRLTPVLQVGVSYSF